MQRPEDDRYLMTQGELESRIQVLLAGTIAEEIIYDDISTGAQNDLERASDIARSMVMDFGMSRLGRVNYRESNRSPFLTGGGSEYGRDRGYSEQTGREIDQEVKRIIDESIEKVRDILESRRASLELLAARLIEREVIDASELKDIMEQTATSPAIVPGTAVGPQTAASDRTAGTASGGYLGRPWVIATGARSPLRYLRSQAPPGNALPMRLRLISSNIVLEVAP